VKGKGKRGRGREEAGRVGEGDERVREKERWRVRKGP